MSVGAAGAEANGASGGFPAVSADGRFVAFASEATNLVANDTNGFGDVFVRDRQLGTTTIVSVATDGTPGNDESGYPMLDAGGRFVVFSSLASNLVSGDTNGVTDVFVRDRDTDADGVYDEAGAVSTTRVSVSSGGAQGDGYSYTWNGGMSADGRHVVFTSGGHHAGRWRHEPRRRLRARPGHRQDGPDQRRAGGPGRQRLQRCGEHQR